MFPYSGNMGILMIVSYKNKLTKDLIQNNFSKEIRKFPNELIRMTRRKLQMIHEAHNINDLKFPPGNKLKKLAGSLNDFYSIRINDQWRITFKFKKGHAYQVSVEDYHS